MRFIYYQFELVYLCFFSHFLLALRFAELVIFMPQNKTLVFLFSVTLSKYFFDSLVQQIQCRCFLIKEPTIYTCQCFCCIKNYVFFIFLNQFSPLKFTFLKTYFLVSCLMT